MLIRGDKLNRRQRQQVLAAFVYRHTVEHPSRHEKRFPPVETDEQWLAGHSFYFIKDGSRLSAKQRYCEPVPR